MEATLRLFDDDSHLFDFTARVLSCDACAGGGYAAVLDSTAFFPEGGGQTADPGFLDGIPVTDVQADADGRILHFLPSPLPVGGVVHGRIDEAVRRERMQCHTGEHLVSGLVHEKYGYNNVGFHLGDADVTLDFDGVLTRGQLDDIEDEVNRRIRACLPVHAYYPDAAELAGMVYRSKLALTEHVRIVEIGDGDTLCDRCACCAPHVSNTGEIGMVKLLDFMHYKGGIRIHMQAGSRALLDYRRRYETVYEIATALSVRQDEAAEAFRRVCAENGELQRRMGELRRRMQEMRASALPETDGNMCLFEEDLDAQDMRRLLNLVVPKCGGICGIFSGSDENGYTYVIGRREKTLDLRMASGIIRGELNARGGGSAEMLQGRASASKSVIERFFDTFTVL